MAMMLRSAALALWELPQNVLGVVNLAALLARGGVAQMARERGRLMVEITVDGAVSLGYFVFYSAKDNAYVPVGPENKDHEYGHSVQSRMLGPLYLPLVGIPSVSRVGVAVMHRALTGKRWRGYYEGWPERQADELGGVDVSLRPPA